MEIVKQNLKECNVHNIKKNGKVNTQIKNRKLKNTKINGKKIIDTKIKEMQAKSPKLKNTKINSTKIKRIKSKEGFVQGIFAMMTSQVVAKVLGLFYKLYLTNRSGFGDEGNAIANAGFQVYALMLSITAIGIPGAISKIIAKKLSIGDHRGANKILKMSLMIFATVGLVGSYFLYSFADIFANQYLHIKEAKLSIIALSPSIFLVSVISVLKGYFNGRESIKTTAKAQGIDQFVNTILTISTIELMVFITKKTNTERMAAISNLSTTFGNIAELTYLIKEYIKIKPEIKKEILSSADIENTRIKVLLKEIAKVAIPISLTALIMSISKNIDSTTIVKELSNVVGYKEAKKQYGILSGKVDPLINLPLSFNMAIITALLPSISATNGNADKINKRIFQSYFIGMAISFPILFIYMCYPNEILNLLFPNATSGWKILRVSAISIIFITLEQINNTILEGLEKPFVPIISILIGVIVKAILNRILVPQVNTPYGGTIGACISTVMCHIVATLISIKGLKSIKNIKLNTRSNIKAIAIPLILSIAMIAITKAINNVFFREVFGTINYKVGFIISLVIGMNVYLILTFKILSKNNKTI